MGAIYRRYHERHRQLRAERAAADLAIADKQLLAELQDRLGLQFSAAHPAPPPQPEPAQPAEPDTSAPSSEPAPAEPPVERRKPKRAS